MRPWLIGEAPSATGSVIPLSGNPARVLCQAAGIHPADGNWDRALNAQFACANLIARHELAYPWSASQARAAAADFLDLMRPRVVVCLGRRVGCAFSLADDHEWGRWVRRSRISKEFDYVLTVVPHPSGRNRTLNDRHQRERLGLALHQAIDRAREAQAA